MSDAFDRFQILYIYESIDKTFKRTILDTPLQGTQPLTEEDLYWLNKETIDLGEAKEFLMTASTWAERFGSDFTVKADVETALSVSLLGANPSANLDETVLEIDVKWYLLPDTIEELYSPSGFVICGGELVRGVFPGLLGKDLSLSGKKKFDKERVKQFFRDEWQLIRRFADTDNPSLETLLVPLEGCLLVENPDLSVQIGNYTLPAENLPEIWDRYGIFALNGMVFYGDQVCSVGLRPFKRFFTGESVSDLDKTDESQPTDGVFPVINPSFWFSNIPFKQASNVSDVFLAGENDFTFLAGQLEYQPTTHEKALSVIKEIKETVSLVSPDKSFDDYRKWQDNFVLTGDTADNSFYCLIFVQELLNELFESSINDKVQMFWTLWQTISKKGSRELKGRFIEAGIDWSLIEQQFGIYGYMSTLKNGYIHNALLWQAFLPENRDYLDPDLLFELANESTSQGVFAENPQYKEIVSRVFGKIDDYYREVTGATFLSSFHPGYFIVRAYMPFKDQIYTGFVKKLMLAEVTPLVFHKPLVNFASAVFSRIKGYLESEEQDASLNLPKPIDDVVKEVVFQFLDK